MQTTADTLVADIAPRSIEVFERHGIDFCCGGRRALGEVLFPRVVSLQARAEGQGGPTGGAR